MMLRGWLVGVLLVGAVACEGAYVGGVRAAQRAGSKLFDVYYDAYGSAEGMVQVGLLVSNGVAAVDAVSVSGAVGESVAEGDRLNLIWDAGVDLPNAVSSNLSIGVSVGEASSTGMVYVPAGSMMVTDADFYGRQLSSAGFLMDAYEVSGALWAQVESWGNDSDYRFSSEAIAKKGSSYPITYVSWEEALVFCNARSEMEGLEPCYRNSDGSVMKRADVPDLYDATASGYRLPTEEEWEFAARGGESGWRFPWGDTISHQEANYNARPLIYDYDESSDTGFHPTYNLNVNDGSASPCGAFEANAYDLYDVVGNVWEWCWDVYSGNSLSRIRRGGAWNTTTPNVQCGVSGSALKNDHRSATGFRTVRSASAGSVEWVRNVALDTRDYMLEVISDHGTPDPSVGSHAYAWQSEVSCSVAAIVDEGGTNYSCAGWVGGGSILPSGASNGVPSVALTSLTSSVQWLWRGGFSDADGDGMNDEWEIDYFSGLDRLPEADADGDGLSNFGEYIAGVNPTNAASCFVVEQVAEQKGEGMVVEWSAVSGRVYSVSWTPNLIYTDFTVLASNLFYPQCSYTDAVHAARSEGSYRLEVRQE